MRGSAKNQGKDIRTKIVGRERERESVCISLCKKKKLSSGGLEKNH